MATAQGGNVFKQAWCAISSFFGSFFGGGDDNTPDVDCGNLTKSQKDEIRRSWAVVWDKDKKENKIIFGTALFINLFKAVPTSQTYFDKMKDIKDWEVLAKDKKMKAHAMRTMSGLNLMVESMDTPDVMDEILSNTARTHFGFKNRVPAKYFDLLDKVLLDTMAQQLGDKCTQKTKDAWAQFYHFIAKQIGDELARLEAEERS